jgi:hypothetical protein
MMALSTRALQKIVDLSLSNSGSPLTTLSRPWRAIRKLVNPCCKNSFEKKKHKISALETSKALTEIRADSIRTLKADFRKLKRDLTEEKPKVSTFDDKCKRLSKKREDDIESIQTTKSKLASAQGSLHKTKK